MSLDPRSRERLEALGRRLPQPLPDPPAKAQAPSDTRHRLETEEDPEQLFRELMAASPDGTVPPHLLERLRQLEEQSRQGRLPPSQRAATPAKRTGRSGAAQEDSALYATFIQLLQEQDEDG